MAGPQPGHEGSPQTLPRMPGLLRRFLVRRGMLHSAWVELLVHMGLCSPQVARGHGEAEKTACSTVCLPEAPCCHRLLPALGKPAPRAVGWVMAEAFQGWLPWAGSWKCCCCPKGSWKQLYVLRNII